ncbi:serine/threonine protein kinase [Streptomyces cynarae]|uniref:non-specific serine/threonine protein kinase n=1 Tax=Streptomyces cynarae TaxID=2981134 RepID=A0ABY6EC09_9ACTN|nr:serine/threonine-protein kinase [Streptomyces cynarae]UXY23762.1 serine/threonine protein kinase [Streptomyces cynarae]
MQPLERIDRYRLERRLGGGAFGVVWLAHDDVLEAPVAVKVLSENWADRLDIRERFLSEARLLRRAGSSRVVQVYDIGELPDGRPYFVMEYADSGTLADRIATGPLPVAEALRLTALTARAAAALHDAGIVHRDVKPSNVLLRTGPDGSTRLLLADLGLAKSLAQASGLTMAAGSAGYAPPEQSEPGSGIDARADVYSLGALGYHLLTGTVPAPPGKVQRPDRLRPDLPPEVQRALMRAMEPERDRRWPTAEALAVELDRLADELGRLAGASSGPARGGSAAVAAARCSPWPRWPSRAPPEPPPPCCCGTPLRRT